MRRAAPPPAGSVQMLPCRSMASVRPSGETPTAIDVPSRTVTVAPVTGAPGADAVPVHAATAARTTRIEPRRIVGRLGEDSRGPVMGGPPLIPLRDSPRQRRRDQLGERLAGARVHEGIDVPAACDHLAVGPGDGRREEDDAASERAGRREELIRPRGGMKALEQHTRRPDTLERALRALTG